MLTKTLSCAKILRRAANFSIQYSFYQRDVSQSAYDNMPRVSKCKQRLAKIALLVVEGNKRCKNVRQIEKNRAYQLRQQEEDDFWDEYESDLTRDSSSDESSLDGEEEEVNDDHADEEIQEETGTSKPELFVFHSGSGDYLRAIRGTGSLSTEKHERGRIRELEKAASNSLYIKTMYKT